MSKRVFAVVVLAMLIGANAGATIVEIPLPDLLGTYPLNEQEAERTASFVLPTTPTAINGVWFRLAGTQQVGEIMCESGGPYPWPMDFLAALSDPTLPGQWLSFSPMPEVTGPFEWTAAFISYSQGMTWDFLLDGEDDITLWGLPMALVGLCWGIVSPTAEVTEAVLIIDAEFPVPVESSTWGRVKALFRAHP